MHAGAASQRSLKPRATGKAAGCKSGIHAALCMVRREKEREYVQDVFNGACGPYTHG